MQQVRYIATGMLQACYGYATGMLDMLQACYRHATGMLPSHQPFPVVGPWRDTALHLHYTAHPHPIASGLGPRSVGPYTHYGSTH